MRLTALVLTAGFLGVGVPAFPQGSTTGAISGRVTDPAGLLLPGVTVTVESQQLQRRRTTESSAHGDYIVPLLPPGDYTIAFEGVGFQRMHRQARVTAGQAVAVDASFEAAALSETITVTGGETPFQKAAAVGSSYDMDLVDKLPTSRSLAAFAQLTPGVQATGPVGAISISGAMSFENLFLVNGVVVNENIRGQPYNLFVEDSLQEVTTSVGAISAEYGRFGGGVVNAVTRSGGNELSGSLRVTLNNDRWRALTPFPNDTRNDDVTPTWEATLGGPIFKDRLWFFGAGRLAGDETSTSTAFTNIPYVSTRDEKRYEGKLTLALNSRNTLRASYAGIDTAVTNSGTGMDLNSLSNPRPIQDLLSVNYTGILTTRLFVDALYSQRRSTFRNAGSQFTDLVRGTRLQDRQRGAFYWSPTFCGVCDQEKRSSQDVLLKASYFLSTHGLGSHSIVAGLDTFNDQRLANNHQSGSDYTIATTTSIIEGGRVFPVMANDASAFIIWNPIFVGSQGTNFRTHSLFVNDSWRLDDRLTFNLGLRYDRNDGEDSAGTVVTRDANLSPRLSMTFDPRGDGAWRLSASYGQYVAALANTIADFGSPAGRFATIQFDYRGPPINTDRSAPLIPTEQALRIVWDWFAANGGTNGPVRGAPSLPGINTGIGDRLVSPNVDELTVGVSHRFGSRLSARVDGVYRDFNDFYSARVDASTGQVTDARLADFGLTPSGRRFDVARVENTNALDRKYRALNLQVAARPGEGVDVGLAYTWSKTYGNVEGETGAAGPIFTGIDVYPEYFDAAWNSTAALSIDARHKLNAWAVWDAPVPEWVGTASVSLLQRFNSGAPYGAFGTIDTRPFVTNPGYATPPAAVGYFFTPRDAFRTDDAWGTDLALNWQRRLVGRGRIFLQAHLLNVFNGQALSNLTDAGCGTGGCVNTVVLTRANSPAAFAAFNPFTARPLQGANWDLGADFGRPLRRFAYQTPRTFRLSMGIRF